jgi:hypothetical protein
MGSKLYYCGCIIKRYIKIKGIHAFCRIKRLFTFFILPKTCLTILLSGRFSTCIKIKHM